jgi:hypothetical protein
MGNIPSDCQLIALSVLSPTMCRLERIFKVTC